MATTANPTMADICTSNTVVQSGAFTSNMPGLAAGTTYHVRAYATNSVGTAYGNDISFVPTNVATFYYTGGVQTWVVPAGRTSVYIKAYGAGGSPGYSAGGYGGYAAGTLAVTPGQTLYVMVGGTGGWANNATFVPGGFNGGGDASVGQFPAACGTVGGGGGASDVRITNSSLANRVLIAGGGGGGAGNLNAIGIAGGFGSSWNTPGAAGNGGGPLGTAASGVNVGSPAGPGTQGAGGSGTGGSTWNGSVGQGGYSSGFPGTTFAAGGGGGLYGGGAGAFSGGGGGSGYFSNAVITGATLTAGTGIGPGGNGLVTITY